MQVRHRQREHVAVAILVLQPFTCQSGAPGRAADEESSAAHIGCRPDQVADTLEPEHRVIDEEGNRVDSVIRISSSRCDERAHRAGLGDAFFQDLPVFCFLVIKKRVHIDRLVVLSDAGINSNLAEERFHTERARFVGNDGNDEFTKLGIAEQFRQQPDEDHGGRDIAAVCALVKFFEMRVWKGLQWCRAHLALRHVSAELLAARLHVLDLGAVVSGAVERRLVQFVVGNRNSEARAEHLQLVFVQLLLLVGDVLAFARLAKAVALDRLGENDGRRTCVIECRAVCRMHFDRIVSPKPHARELVV